MSKYTTEVRYICETNAGLTESQGYSNVKDIIANSRAKIFDFDYPIFDEAYKPTLETKILKHYYTREIGLETVGLWKHFLDMRMNEIMPYYNKLYESELIEFNPLYDVDYTREGNRTESEDRTDEETRTDAMTGTVADVGTGSDDMTGTVADVGTGSDEMTGTVTDSGTSTSTDGGTESRQGSNVPKKDTWDLYSDTPQGGINGIQDASNDPSLASNAYLTNARHIIEDGTGSTEQSTTTFGKTNNSTSGNTRTYNTDNSTTDNNTRTYNTSNDTTNNNTRTYNTQNAIDGSKTGNTAREGEYFERIRGKMSGKSYAKMLQELRETFLNIDMMIIEDLSDLFLNIY